MSLAPLILRIKMTARLTSNLVGAKRPCHPYIATLVYVLFVWWY